MTYRTAARLARAAGSEAWEAHKDPAPCTTAAHLGASAKVGATLSEKGPPRQWDSRSLAATVRRAVPALAQLIPGEAP